MRSLYESWIYTKSKFWNKKIRKQQNLGKDRIDAVYGVINNKRISIYSQYKDNELVSKLYYLQDQFFNLLKLKLVGFKDGKKTKTFIKQTKI